ncbi:MAG: hypothetical protein LH467_01880, partial [Gemmatimonadaceae bacterium]|nr:hypothetical protein [Gemmatimonadaceae bacterium]
MSSSADGAWASVPRPAASYDGLSSSARAARLAVPSLLVYDQLGSTFDVAHRVAPDAPSGTLILADEQTAGRGRHGRRWSSAAGTGIWLTLIERPRPARARDGGWLRGGRHPPAARGPLAGA